MSIFSYMIALSVAATNGQFDAAAQRQKLSDFLAGKDYRSLAEELRRPESQPEFVTDLDWLGENFKNGERAFVAVTYARMLLVVADRWPKDKGDELRGTALGALLYAAITTPIDSGQCADATARSYRYEQTLREIESADLLKLDKRYREGAAVIALMVEKINWSKRKANDDSAFLCVGGMAAMVQGLAAGDMKEVAPALGQVGKQFVVGSEKGFRVERRKDEDWWPSAESARKDVPKHLKLLAQLDEEPDVEKLMAPRKPED